MKLRKLMLSGIAASATVAASFATPAIAQDRILFNVGTAGITGSFWAIGGQICNLVNRSREAQGHALRCTVESTTGSVGNLRALAAGDLDIVFAQSDLEYQAYHGEAPFDEGAPFEDLRFLMSFTVNSMQVIVRDDSGISTMQDLVGKRVNTGNPGSGTEASSYMLLDYFGIDPNEDLGLDSKLPSREQAQALCDGRIDAFMYPSSVPVATIEEAANTCDIEMVSLDGPELEKLLADRPYLQKTEIPAGSYHGMSEGIVSFGYAATLLTREELGDEVAYNLARAVMDSFEQLKGTSPMLADLTRERAVSFGRHVPYHPGAERYYQETGLIQ